MSKKKFAMLASLALAFHLSVSADETAASSSDYLKIPKTADAIVPFSISDQGKKLPVVWGLDTAWPNESNMMKGVNHIGRKDIGIARVSYQTTYPLIGDTALTASQIASLKERIRLVDLISKTVDVVVNEDQEASVKSMPEYYRTADGKLICPHWAAVIAATVKWIKQNTSHRVIAVSVFNEPDYAWNKGTKADMKEISRLLHEDYKQLFDGIAFSAGNTLNCDKADEWYSAVKPYCDWGNTHQLAGEFGTYASFFQKVEGDGNYPTADEMHNIGDALVGAEYGMKAGIWWGFDSRARGELGKISNHGTRLAYAEQRGKWTAAAVYRHDETGKAKAFVGSSERQASTTGYLFVSKDRDIYADGEGPLRDFYMNIPGGTGYQKGQTNAERVINVEYGEDVPPAPIAGKYTLLNVGTGNVAAQYGTEGANPAISVAKYTGANTQQWNVEWVDERNGGDYSYYKITCAGSGKYMNVLNNSKNPGTGIIAYNANCASNEQWFLEYAGNGSYRIINRESGLYLQPSTRAPKASSKLIQDTLRPVSSYQLWRIIPTDAECELVAPAQPSGLSAVGQSASVSLSWNANSENDLEGYMILRADKDTKEWNTIARKVKTTTFVDNTCLQGHSYLYKIKAIDRSDNFSVCSDSVLAATSGERKLAASWKFKDDLADGSENRFNAISKSEPAFVKGKSCEKAISLANGNYLRLPYGIGGMKEMTICVWVYSRGTSGQHLFDFGNGTDEYIYLSPKDTNGGWCMGFKKGADEQKISMSFGITNYSWKHIAVVMAQDSVTVFQNGKKIMGSTEIALRPSDISPVFNYIGRGQDNATPTFSGYLDGMSIYNYPLTAEEVAAVMNETAAIETEKAEESSPSVLYNLSGQKTDGNGKGIVINQGKKTLRN